MRRAALQDREAKIANFDMAQRAVESVCRQSQEVLELAPHEVDALRRCAARPGGHVDSQL